MIHHNLDSTKDGGNGDFMYCHSSMASKQLLNLRKTNILLAEELKISEKSEEHFNYFRMPKEEQCEGNQDLIGKLTPIMKEHLKSITEVVKIYGKGVNKMFLEYLEQEIKMVDNWISWTGLDEIEEKNIIKVHQEESKQENKEDEFPYFFQKVCKIIMDLDDKPKHSNKKVMEKESYLNHRRSEEEEPLLIRSRKP